MQPPRFPAGSGRIRRWIPAFLTLALALPAALSAAEGEEDGRFPAPDTARDGAKDAAPDDPSRGEREQEAGQPRQDEEEQQPARASWTESVVVTAKRAEEPVVDSVAFVTSMDSEQLSSSPGVLLDEALGRVPGFGLFRRNTSLISHPTTTGVSLRGIGPSGASRSLVLWDGLPLNDPFGNWVYWNRLPTLLLDRVEIARGAASPLYGSSSLGGTIQLVSRDAEPRTILARVGGGNLGTMDAEALASHRAENLSLLGAVRLFRSNGYHRIREADRGGVDQPAGVDFESFVGRVGYGDAHLGISYYREDRENGTPLQVNDSFLGMLEGGYATDDWEIRLFGSQNKLNSDFSRIFPGRDREVQTAQTTFEYDSLGASLLFRLPADVQAGADFSYATWDGRSQRRVGTFLQKRFVVGSRFEIVADGRLDGWENNEFRASANPRLGVRYHVASNATLRASGYRGFRAPSLNELYRPFRVGNVRTAANDQLGEETLYGGEAGFDLHPARGVLVRGNAFWNSLRDAVGNVTIEVNEEGVFRQRQNIGPATVIGAEAEVRARIGDDIEVIAAYLFSRTEVEDTGLRLPQVPLHQGSFGVRYSGPVDVLADVRFMSDQFEDDRNQLPMDGFASVGFRIAAPIRDRIRIYVAAENILNAEIVSARTPIETLGTPRAVHAGLDLRLGE